MAWNFYSNFISSYNPSLPNFSSQRSSMWVHHPNPQFWPVLHFLLQPSSQLLHLVWFLVISISLVCDHHQTNSLPGYQASLTIESYKHLLTDLLLELCANLNFAPGPIYFLILTEGTKVHPLDMVGHAKERRLRQCTWWSRLRHGCRRALACSGHYARLLPPRPDLHSCLVDPPWCPVSLPRHGSP